MMKWKIFNHTDDHFEVEFEDGNRLNFYAGDIVNRYLDPTPAVIYREPPPTGKGLRHGGVIYVFDKDGFLPEHKHDEKTLHTIECVKGKVVVHRAVQGDIVLVPGQTAELLVDESHSVTALEDSKTVHWLINS